MNHTLSQWPTRHLFDVRIDAVTTNDVLDAVDHAIAARRRLLITVLNAAKTIHIERDEGLRRAVVGADLILADGMSIVWACRLLRMPLPERVTGIDLMSRMLDRAHHHSYRLYLLGAKEEVLAQVRRRIERDYPGIIIAGARNGYYNPADEESIADDVSKSKPDILLVGMSSPRKEKFIAQWGRVMGVPVCHGVGGAFDVLAGKVHRAPRIIQRLGLEWAYRAAQEPRRLLPRYLETNTLFAWKVLNEAVRRTVRYTVSPVKQSVAFMRGLGIRMG